MLFRYLLLLFVGLIGCVGCKPIQSPDAVVKVSEGDASDEFPRIDFTRLKKVDILGIPFGDTVLNEFDTARNIGVNNLNLQDDFVLRFAHLARQHAPDLEAMGFESCFDYDPDARAPKNYRQYQSGAAKPIKATASIRVSADLWKARHCFLQRVHFPDDYEWKTARSGNLKPPRVISLFMPNVLTVYLDSNGTWPLGRRPNDDMIGRFNALFLKMGNNPGDCSGEKDFLAVRRRGDSPGAPQAPYNKRCSMLSLSRPSEGQAANKYHGWKTDRPAIPLNAQHEPRFQEDQFPFILPPNDGPGYYQSTSNTADLSPRADVPAITNSARDWARKDYKDNDPFARRHPYCEKDRNGKWKESTKAYLACQREGVRRYGDPTHISPTVPADENAPGFKGSLFMRTCVANMEILCRS